VGVFLAEAGQRGQSGKLTKEIQSFRRDQFSQQPSVQATEAHDMLEIIKQLVHIRCQNAQHGIEEIGV